MANRPRVAQDSSVWIRHFKDMTNGNLSTARSCYKLKSKHINPPSPPRERIRVVAETAQVVQQAKSQLHEEESEAREPKPRGYVTGRQPPSKRKYNLSLKDLHVSQRDTVLHENRADVFNS